MPKEWCISSAQRILQLHSGLDLLPNTLRCEVFSNDLWKTTGAMPQWIAKCGVNWFVCSSIHFQAAVGFKFAGMATWWQKIIRISHDFDWERSGPEQSWLTKKDKHIAHQAAIIVRVRKHRPAATKGSWHRALSMTLWHLLSICQFALDLATQHSSHSSLAS